MKQLYLIQLDYLLRLFIAAVCGMAIGYERKNRMKEAGIRTHFIVAIGAALIMIISKYGFQDQIGWPNMSLDPSRIAAQVVTGVGFLGAGVIFMQKQTIVGLTTAA
ncbi:MgtC/SapB family protein, partial [Clostridium sp. IBUN13A]